MSLTLTDAELVAITKRDRPTAQARILRLLGVPFARHPVDGILLVDRNAASAVLTGKPAQRAPAVVNVEGIRNHAKGTRARGR